MENRSRVSVILNSQAFKDELEQVVEEQLRNGPYPASLIALQQITDLLLPQSKGSLGSLARGLCCMSSCLKQAVSLAVLIFLLNETVDLKLNVGNHK